MGCVFPTPRFPHTTEEQGLEVTSNWGRRSAPDADPLGSREGTWLPGGSLPRQGDGGHLRNWAEHERKLREEGRGPEPEPPDVPVQVDPQPLPTGGYTPQASEASALLDPGDLEALAAAVPLRHKWRFWQLLYSSARDGFSLQTLYRRSPPATPAVLVVRDLGGATFGCFTPEAWRVSKRYYGTGETFVFQVKPQRQLWRWHEARMAVQRNDFFQFSTGERLALGGAPQYALSLDADLRWGSSGPSEAFGSACLASGEVFEIGRVELWGLF